MREGLRLLQEIKTRHWQPFYRTLLAEAEAEAGRLDVGLATINAQLPALSLAKLYHALHRNLAARELLASALPGFSEGVEVPEVAEANRLLRLLDQISGVA